MKREILVCDRCNTSAETVEERKELALASVHVGFNLHYGSYSGVRGYPGHALWAREWCHKCRLELGIAGTPNEVSGKPGDEVPSLEDMIREIVRQEMPQS